MIRFGRTGGAKLSAALVAAGLAIAPALAVAATKNRPPAISLSVDRLSSFTPAAADPRLAASFGNRGISLTDFKFTPAAAKGRPSQVRVAIRTRASTPVKARLADASSGASTPALAPTSYDLGVAVGWRRFAVAGDVARAESANPSIGGRESAVVGVSYSLKKFIGRVAVGAERADGTGIAALRAKDEVSVDVGGAYSITRDIALTGGVRYSIERDRASTLSDQRRDNQAVYVGTAFKF